MSEIEKKKNQLKYKLTGGYHPAVLCVWAAIQACCNLFPAVALIGVGGTMTIANAIIPLSGIFFGPYAGALCAAIGQIIGMLISPSSAWLGVFTFLLGTCTAFVAGLLSRGNWKLAYAMNALGIAIFYCFPVGRVAWIKGVTFGISGILTCLIGGIFAKHFINSRNPLWKAISIWACASGGLLTTCMFADEVSIILFHTPAISMKMLCIISPTERMIFGVCAAVVGVPLLMALPKIGIHVGPDADKDKDEGSEDPDEVIEETLPEETK